jgi:hypothetical protein
MVGLVNFKTSLKRRVHIDCMYEMRQRRVNDLRIDNK